MTAGEAKVRELGCATCHGAAFAGRDLVPRLAGQASGYLATQLEAFAGGQRPHPAAPLPAAGDAEAVAAYLSASSR